MDNAIFFGMFWVIVLGGFGWVWVSVNRDVGRHRAAATRRHDAYWNSGTEE